MSCAQVAAGTGVGFPDHPLGLLPVAGAGLISFPGDMLVVIYFLVMSSVFAAAAGFAARSPFPSLGGIRELTQLFSYEIPFVISLVTIGLITGFMMEPNSCTCSTSGFPRRAGLTLCKSFSS